MLAYFRIRTKGPKGGKKGNPIKLSKKVTLGKRGERESP